MSRENFKDTLVTAHGKTMTLPEWADDLGIAYVTMCARYRAGKRGDELLRIIKPPRVSAADLRAMLGEDIYNLIETRAEVAGMQPITWMRYVLQRELLEKTP